MSLDYKMWPKLGLEAIRSWNRHNALRLGASLAFYTVFAIAPLFVIALAIAGFWFGEEAARRQLFDELYQLIGSKGGEAIQAVVAAADRPKAGFWAAVVAVITLLTGATGVFVELQAALNTIWEVRRLPGRGLRFFLRDRLLSFAMVLAIGFILLVSLVVSAGLAAMGKFMSGLFPDQEALWGFINFAISLAVITVLFALILKALPDVNILWRDVWLGALLTAALFNVGKLFLGLYLGRSSVASAYGAAGSFVIILLWVYYSSQTLFLGAEFARVYAKHKEHRFTAKKGAEFIEVKETPVGSSIKT